MTSVPVTSAHESPRIAEAREHATQRIRRQRDTLRPMGWAVVLVVVAGAIGEQPHPAIQGKGLGVTLAVLAFAGALAIATGGRFTERGTVMQTAVISLMGAAGVALVALQPQGATELGGGAAVWMAVVRLPLPLGISLGVVIGVGLDTAAALSGSSSTALLAASLLLTLIGLVGYFMKQSRASQDWTELLLAQLENAREEQTRAAAVAERGRIAGELHDVLAHSLSGAAIQLQAARKLADREHATPSLHAAIDRAGALVKEGLANARQAVGALRGDELPGVSELDALVQRFRDDMQANVNLSIEGNARTLPADAGLALYRGAQEALTNVARYAHGAVVDIALRYEPDHTTLRVEDRSRLATGPQSGEGLQGVGGGRGLAGLRERVERVGGSVHAGPTDDGWLVEVVVPA
ncbi:MAG TPA: histidine kinase [Candidatus Saccharimonadales bacterium]|nr:histidine kinase [Candidatus Saccharimonadales bacterium]